MAIQEFPKWMHHADQGSRIFNTKEDLEAAGSGWVADRKDAHDDATIKTEQELASARATGLGDSQKVADLELKLAEAKKQMADANLPPGNASPGTARIDAVEERTLGHNGIEFATKGGNREVVQGVDTLSLDAVQAQLRYLGVKYDETATLASLQRKLLKVLKDPDSTRAGSSNSPNVEDTI